MSITPRVILTKTKTVMGIKGPLSSENALREFRVDENFYLGNDSQSEHYIQEMNRFKTMAQACKVNRSVLNQVHLHLA